jgi:hypothetical protein
MEIFSFLFLLKLLAICAVDNNHLHSPSIISLTPSEDLLSRKWLDQWPIGNGKFGALVGGSIQGDIIPLSVAGLYTVTRSSAPQQDPIFLHQQFQQSREALLAGDFQESQKKFSSLISKSPLGMFQYLGDISLVFSPRPLYLMDSVRTIPARGIKERKVEVGRRKVWNLHQNLFKYSNPKENKMNNFQKIQFQNHALDTKNGIMKSIFHTSSPGNNEIRNISTNSYSRVWYASAVDDVIVGKLQCRFDDQHSSTSSSSKDIFRNCLHYSLRYGRHVNKKEDMMPESGWDLRRYSSSNSGILSGNEIMFGNLKIPKKNIYSFHASLTPSPPVHHRDVELCGVVICLPPSISSSENPSGLIIIPLLLMFLPLIQFL